MLDICYNWYYLWWLCIGSYFYCPNSCVFYAGYFQCFWIKEWFTSDDMVFANLHKTFSRVFCSLLTCNIFDILNFANFSLDKMTYHCSNGSFGMGFSLDLWEFIRILMLFASIPEDNMRSEITTSYPVWLLVLENSKRIDTSIVNLDPFSRISEFPRPQLLDEPYVNITQAWLGSGAPRVIFAIISANNCAFNVFLNL